MLKYETLMLTPTKVTADEIKMLEGYFENLLSDSKGKLLLFDRWGKYKLAYPVKKNDYGIYLLARFELPQEETKSAFKKLSDFFKIKCSEIVLRNVTMKLDKTATLTYKHPDPIDGKAGHLDDFIKESKIENLLSSVDSQKAEAKAEETEETPVKAEEKEETKEVNTEENKEA